MLEFLSELDTNQKLEIAKFATVFAGGVLVGFSIKKVLDSYDLDVIKDNALNMVEDYVNPKKSCNEINNDVLINEEFIDY